MSPRHDEGDIDAGRVREPGASAASSLLTELKVRARLRRNAGRGEQPEQRLRDCLHGVAQDLGFAHWEQARRVLGGEARPGDDMGRFWHAPACDALLNGWFADVDRARVALAADPSTWLVPYGRQFVVVRAPYLLALGLDPADPAWAATHRDLVRGYGSAAWRALAARRLKAPPGSFSAVARPVVRRAVRPSAGGRIAPQQQPQPAAAAAAAAPSPADSPQNDAPPRTPPASTPPASTPPASTPPAPARPARRIR